MRRILTLALLVALAGCGGAGSSGGSMPLSPVPPASVTIPDPIAYLVQASCKGALPTQCTNSAPVSFTAPDRNSTQTAIITCAQGQRAASLKRARPQGEIADLTIGAHHPPPLRGSAGRLILL